MEAAMFSAQESSRHAATPVSIPPALGSIVAHVAMLVRLDMFVALVSVHCPVSLDLPIVAVTA